MLRSNVSTFLYIVNIETTFENIHHNGLDALVLTGVCVCVCVCVCFVVCVYL
jgi:hypothetical protein